MHLLQLQRLHCRSSQQPCGVIATTSNEMQNYEDTLTALLLREPPIAKSQL